MDNGVTLDLTFTAGAAQVLTAHAQAAGCGFIKLGDGTVVWAARESGQPFWQALADALGTTVKALSGFDSPQPTPASPAMGTTPGAVATIEPGN